ncbi:hypothetical protein CLH62_01835 [Marinobacter guineae]|uniref:Carrier domain-containing protein n=1 Tax=Marinobacter guineae TaxID=432303 RepID=A0A2G1VI24_9GAMM|nr:non-ribosomal peptide synthetase [Marinobacter guineae]PHQ26364.1 hypothetical protein CLH62_01835 [Marinobacter guineae]
MERAHRDAGASGSITAKDEFLSDSGNWPQVSYDQLFLNQCHDKPEKLAVISDEETLSYKELERKSSQWAYWLSSEGVKKGDKVLVCMERLLELPAILLGIMRAGACYVPVDPAFPPRRIAVIIEDSDSVAVITDKASEHLLPLEYNFRVFVVEDKPRSIEPNPLPDWCPDDLAYLIFTSGSTGRPKGVPITRAAMVNFLLAMSRRPGIHSGDRVMALTTISFDISVLELFLPLMVGATMYLVPKPDSLDPRRLSAIIQDNNLTLLQATPATWRMLLEHGWTPDRSQKILSGGEPLTIELAKLLYGAGELWNMYGPTEATVWSSCHQVNADDLSRGAIPIGDPIANVHYRVVSADDHKTDEFAQGELLISGVCLTPGYFQRPDLNAERFLSLLNNETGAIEHWYRTGDLVLREGSSIFYLDRLDNQVKIRGYRVELGEIEKQVSALGRDVTEVAVIKHTGSNNNPYLIAFIRSAVKINFEALETELAARLPEYMIPRVWRQVESFPLTPNLKIDRKSLAELADRELSQTESLKGAPQSVSMFSGEVKRIALLWEDILGVAPSGPEDNFYSLGGHSLLAAKLSTSIEREFGKQIPPVDLLDHPVLLQQAALIRNSPAREAQQHGRHDKEISESIDKKPVFPPTKTQMRMDVTAALHDQPEIFYESEAYWLFGEVDAKSLKKAAAELLNRHDALAIIRAKQQKYWVHTKPVLEWKEIVCGGALDDRRWLDGQLQDEAQSSFNLHQGPLIRFKLYLGNDNKCVLQISAHHQIIDGISQTQLWQELKDLYAFFNEGAPNTENKARQFSEYLGSSKREENPDNLKYWSNIFRTVPPVLEMVTDKPRPPTLDLRSDQQEITIPNDVLDNTIAVAKELRTTPFVIFLSTYCLLLARYTGKNEIVIGTPANQRPDGFEHTIGLFINTVPLRLHLGEKNQFTEIVAHVHAQLLGAIRHQDFSFDRIVDIIQPDRDPSRTPVYQTLFTFNDFRERPVYLDNDIVMRPCPVDTGFSHTELVLFADWYREGMDLRLQASKKLFNRTTIESLLGHFRVLLTELLRDTSCNPRDVNLLTPHDQKVLRDWSNTTTDYPRDASLLECFKAQVESHSDKIAIEQGELQISYSELEAQSNRVASALIGSGVGKGTSVGLLAGRSWQTIAALLGVLRVGAVYVPLDRTYPPKRLRLLLSESKTKYVIGQYEEDRFHLPEGTDWISLDEALRNDSREAGSLIPCSAVDPAYIMFTSGSTGVPKGVEVVHRNIIRLVKNNSFLPLDCDTRFLMNAPISFDASTLEIWGPLLNGGTLIIPQRDDLNAKALSEILLSGRVNVAWFTAALFHQMAQHHTASFSKLRYLLAGGDVLSARWVRAVLKSNPQLTLINGYGPTENTTFTCCYPMHDYKAVPDRVPIGYPVANTQVHVIDDHGALCPPGVPGELYAGGDGVANGYVNFPDRTRDVFVSGNKFIGTDTKLYRTGDRVRWRHDGVLEFLGRMDDQIKIRGHRVEPGEISAALENLKGVRQATTVVERGIDANPEIIAYVVLDDGAADRAKLNKLRKDLEDHLPRFMLPRDIIGLSELPVDPNGKVDRRALPRSDLLETKNSQGVPPENRQEARLLKIWQEILARPDLGVTDDFFEWGGSSLKAVELFGNIEGEFGCDLPLSLLLKQRTVRDLSNSLDFPVGRISETSDSVKAQWNNLVVLEPKSGSHPVVCIHAVGGNVLSYRGLLDLDSLNRPVLGFQSSGLNGIDDPPNTITAMATQYVEELGRSGYGGPFTLIGGSMGGTIALEMAYLLEQKGEEVDWVILLDTIGPEGRRLESEMLHKSLWTRFQFSLQSRLRQYQKKLQILYYRYKEQPIPVELRPFFIKDHNIRALYRHSEKTYQGNVLLLRAPMSDRGIYADPYLGWKGVLEGRLIIECIDAFHESFLESPATKARLNQFFRENNIDDLVDEK